MPEVESRVATLEAKVSRNELDIQKTIDSIEALRKAATELTINLEDVDELIKDIARTLYGNGDRKNSLVSIADRLNIDVDHFKESVESARVSSTEALEIAKTVKQASESVISANKSLLGNNLIQYGRIRLSGKSADIAAYMIIPILCIYSVLTIIYFIMALFGKAPWPWA